MYITPSIVAVMLDLSAQRVRDLLRDGKFEGSKKCDCSNVCCNHGWLIPIESVKKPADKRVKSISGKESQ